MREALALISAEGLPSLWERHRRLHLVLLEGLAALGLEPFVVSDADRLVSVNTIKVRAPEYYRSLQNRDAILFYLDDASS